MIMTKEKMNHTTNSNNESLRKVTRIGVYGIALKNQSILLIDKKSGCYKGLLDLPGGGIEFGESPEETLRREFIEEVGMKFQKMELISNLAHNGDFLDVTDPFRFHQLGLLYNVYDFQEIEGAICEEIFSWYTLPELKLEKLTPFAKAVVKQLTKPASK